MCTSRVRLATVISFILTDNSNILIDKNYINVFISHASADKEDYVDELRKAVKKLGVSVFYDTDEISWGDNWKEAILSCTAESEFAVIVISNHFFGREWTERELKEFLGRQYDTGQKIVLPLLYGITTDDLKNIIRMWEIYSALVRMDIVKMI